ncbi:hypothetical protein [Schumannella luteola]
MTEMQWRHQFVLSERERKLGRTAELMAAIRAGELVRVSRGVYRRAAAIPADSVRRADDAYLAILRAAQLRSGEPLQFAGMSAARLWNLPVIGDWPARASVLVAREAGGRSNSHVARTYVGHPARPVELGGLLATTLERTAADVARTESLVRAVAIMDAALRGNDAVGRLSATRGRIGAELETLQGAPGIARAVGVLSFADGRSGSPGESCSRVGMWKLGFPVPVLQQRWTDRDGLIGFSDFWWPDMNLIGEFDGFGKYVRSEFTHGRSIEEIVFQEKQREDRLRACGQQVVRWGWNEALSLPLLERKLRGAGLEPR